jgi:hypothetical protein
MVAAGSFKLNPELDGMAALLGVYFTCLFAALPEQAHIPPITIMQNRKLRMSIISLRMRRADAL